jgi:hypothetical protein
VIKGRKKRVLNKRGEPDLSSLEKERNSSPPPPKKRSTTTGRTVFEQRKFDVDIRKRKIKSVN